MKTVFKCPNCDHQIADTKIYCDLSCYSAYIAKVSIKNSWAVCEFCLVEFQQHRRNKGGSYSRNKTCSPECAKKLKRKRGRENKNAIYCYWSKAEENLLAKWIQIKPTHLIYKDWNVVAAQQGWKERPYEQIVSKAVRLVKSDPRLKDNWVAGRNPEHPRIHVTKDNWSLQDLKRILGIRRYGRVLRWVHKKGLEYVDVSSPQKQYYAISRKALRKFASKHPEEFWGITQRNLRKVLPKPLADKLFKLNRERQPTNGRAIPVIRLDTGDVYRSGTAAATALKLNVSMVIDSAKTDKQHPNGMDFFRFDYPTYWVPPDVVQEFNFVAGKILYQLYLEICAVTGYKKQSCLLVAARLAIKITLTAFRSSEKYKALGQCPDPVEEIANFWQDIMLKKLIYVFNLQQGVILQKIIHIIKKRVFKNCIAIAKGDKLLADDYAQDFVNFYIQKEIAKYYRESYLPINYMTKDKLQYADLWAHIYHSLNLYIWVGTQENGTLKQVAWINLCFQHFQQNNCLEPVKTVVYIDTYKEHNHDYDQNDQTSSQSLELESLLTKAKEIYNKNTFEQLSMFVALKLEEASDREIADCLGINISAISKMMFQLQKCV
jgi:hypothetical protein